MRRTMIGVVVALLVLTGAAVAAAQSETETGPESGVAAPLHERWRPLAFLQEVLDDLVSEGTIEEADAEAVMAEVEARVDQKREELQARLEERREMWESFWGDGVLSQDEIAQLPEQHPLRDPDGPLSRYLADGQVTEEEWEQIREEFGPFRRHHRHPFRSLAGPGTGA